MNDILHQNNEKEKKISKAFKSWVFNTMEGGERGNCRTEGINYFYLLRIQKMIPVCLSFFAAWLTRLVLSGILSSFHYSCPQGAL
ncbi:hypothetical protein DXA68_02640 [Bacteroides stercorirosoris]|uniref:Uncharacterized protein n=1 Tax=Bacteroides stercorirosoris TaxID=871324 RepID=A0A413HAV1_9BACE|nr:hypothetical protein DXA68_02640 [Bacteroides stercorirosoris]